MKRWYAVRTKARQEDMAVDNLRRQAFDTYLPRIRGAKRRDGHWQTVVEPLIPGDLFVSMDISTQSIAPIQSTRGVIGLIQFGNELRPVPENVIMELSDAQVDERTPIDPAYIFKNRDRVRFVEGPMAGMTAILEAKTDAERVLLLMDMLGQRNHVACSPHSIVSAA